MLWWQNQFNFQLLFYVCLLSFVFRLYTFMSNWTFFKQYLSTGPSWSTKCSLNQVYTLFSWIWSPKYELLYPIKITSKQQTSISPISNGTITNFDRKSHFHNTSEKQKKKKKKNSLRFFKSFLPLHFSFSLIFLLPYFLIFLLPFPFFLIFFYIFHFLTSFPCLNFPD